MRILHVTSDWKWTGPAEPMLGLALAQAQRGYDVRLACPESPRTDHPGVAVRARRAGLDPVLEFERARGVRPVRERADAGRLAALLAERPADVVHAWHTRDHVLAWRAARRCGAARPRVVRSAASAEPPGAWPWNRWLFGRAADGVLCVSPASARAMARVCAPRPAVGALGAVDLERFRPAAPDPDVRRRLGLEPHHWVVGVVARVQRHRRFDLLLEALARLDAADSRLLVVGRGTHLDAVAREPARRLGIADRVVFAGYREADYVDVLRSIDLLTFLVPGSDGTCRALLEAQACGVPAVTSRRGALPEIVADGETGWVVDEDAAALAGLWAGVLGDPGGRAARGRAARARAERHFSFDRLCGEVAELYGAAGAGGSPV